MIPKDKKVPLIPFFYINSSIIPPPPLRDLKTGLKTSMILK